VLTTVAGASLAYTHSFASGTYYYYAEITQADGQKAWTSPIWYTKIVTPLPVEMLSFTGEYSSKGNLLEWITASEINNDYFLLERSPDGKNFKAIGQLKGAGNSTQIQKYNFLDIWAPEGVNYYRLKQFDFDGDYTYSNIVAIRTLMKDELFLIYPNPAQNSFIISVKNALTSGYDLRILNSLGQTIYSEDNIRDEHFKFSPGLADGIYTVSLIINNEISNKKLVIRNN
jgi:hypothetical protein